MKQEDYLEPDFAAELGLATRACPVLLVLALARSAIM